MTRQPVDMAIASIGLPRHAQPHDIAKQLRQAANIIETSALTAIDRASILAARGYSAQTLGDGGSRGTDDTSSTHRHAIRAIPQRSDDGKRIIPPAPDTQWNGIDQRLAKLLATLDQTSVLAAFLIADINHHGSDIDPIPAGQGECMACGRTCRPKDNPNDRLKAGLCPADYKAWGRDGRKHHGQWVAARRKALTDDQGRVHPPQPNGDMP